MIFKSGREIWVRCDHCGVTFFGGFVPESKVEVMHAMSYTGWTFDGKVLCPLCAEKAQKAVSA